MTMSNAVAYHPNRVTRRLRKKIAQIKKKVATTVSKQNNAKISSSNINLKAQNINNKPLINSQNAYNKPNFAQKNPPGPLKSNPNGEISPNLVTLHPNL
jgi:hypothetical protein